MQDGGLGELDGYNDANETPDRNQAEAAVQVVAELYRRHRCPERPISGILLVEALGYGVQKAPWVGFGRLPDPRKAEIPDTVVTGTEPGDIAVRAAQEADSGRLHHKRIAESGA